MPLSFQISTSFHYLIVENSMRSWYIKIGLTSPVHSFKPQVKSQPTHCVMTICFRSLPQFIKLCSYFSAFWKRISHFYHGNIRNPCHLHSWNHSPTSLRFILRLGRTPYSNMKSFRQRSCGCTETPEHLFLQCNLSLHHRNLILLTLKTPCSMKIFMINLNTLLLPIKL